MTRKLPVTPNSAPKGTLVVEQMAGGGFVVQGEENTRNFQPLVQKYALKLEILGLRNSRGSVYAMVKKQYGFKGNKQSVYDQLCAYIDKNIKPAKPF